MIYYSSWVLKNSKLSKANYSQTKIYSDTFNISHVISQFICYSLENGNKVWQELRVKLCQNKFILIMSDNFDWKVCNGLQSIKKYLAAKFKYTIR